MSRFAIGWPQAYKGNGSCRLRKAGIVDPTDANEVQEISVGCALMDGWVSLPTCGDVYLEHGLPRRVWTADNTTVFVKRLVAEIIELTGLHVTLCAWESGEREEGMEAALRVSPADIDLVLQHLAETAVEMLVDRNHREINSDDLDYGKSAVTKAVQRALGLCGLNWNQVNERELRQDYCRALHRASNEMASRYEH